MNYLQRSFQISFALHALAVLLLIFMGDRFISSEKILVIDFTLEDTAGAETARDSATVKTQTLEHNVRQTEIRKMDAEDVEPSERTVPQAVPPVPLNSPKSLTLETQAPVSSHDKATEPSGKNEQGVPGKVLTEAGGPPVVGGDTKAGSVRGMSSEDEGKIRYLKANFSYIKALIDKHRTYPEAARRMGRQGKVKISFFVSSDGDAKGIKVVESSGIGVLDKDAVETVKRASPFPKPPSEAQIIIPIRYQLD